LESNKLDSWLETLELKNEESSRLDGDPSDWINCPELGRNSRLQEFKNPVDWMMIHATGLINPNQAESPRGILMKIQSTGWCSRRLDSRKINFKESSIVF
jgi:hypothetical protein